MAERRNAVPDFDPHPSQRQQHADRAALSQPGFFLGVPPQLWSLNEWLKVAYDEPLARRPRDRR
jgi:hypothetical protein